MCYLVSSRASDVSHVLYPNTLSTRIDVNKGTGFLICRSTYLFDCVILTNLEDSVGKFAENAAIGKPKGLLGNWGLVELRQL